MIDVQGAALLARTVLRERAADLIAEACAWSVGLSDQPHLEHRDGRLVASGDTLGMRAEAAQPLSTEGWGRFALAGAAPGSFQDALNALTRDGGVLADRFDEEVLSPFAVATGVQAAERLREDDAADWAELLDELGEDGEDLPAVVRALEWDTVLKEQAEQLVLDALGPVPLVQVEAEGTPLAVVRAAERELLGAAPSPQPEPAETDPAVLFLAEAALDRSGLARPVLPADAELLLAALLAEGLEPEEVLDVLDLLPVHLDTAERVSDLLGQAFS